MAIAPAGSKGGCRHTVQKVCLMVCRRHEGNFRPCEKPTSTPIWSLHPGSLHPEKKQSIPSKDFGSNILFRPVYPPPKPSNTPPAAYQYSGWSCITHRLRWSSFGIATSTIPTITSWALTAHTVQLCQSKTSSSPLLLFSSSILLGSSRKCR